MKHFGRIKALVVTGALALGGLAVAAAPAHAGTVSMTALGGPGVVQVTGWGFTADATVNLVVLEDIPNAGGGPGNIGAALTNQIPVQVQPDGYLGYTFYHLSDNGSSYSGNVFVAANQLSPAPPVGPGGTLFAQAAVTSPPAYYTSFPRQYFCGDDVSVEAYGFDTYASVQLELWTQHFKLVSADTAPGAGSGEIGGTLPTDGQTGMMWVSATQGNSDTGGATPAPIWAQVSVC
jgi:hypothetical protein